jgi:hypothetical protein
MLQKVGNCMGLGPVDAYSHIHSYVAIRKRDGDKYLVDILIVSPIEQEG